MIFLGRPNRDLISELRQRSEHYRQTVLDFERLSAETVKNLRKTRRPKAAVTTKATTQTGPEACHATGNQVGEGLAAMMHRAVHQLTGKCITCEVCDLDGRIGEAARQNGRFHVIRVNQSLTGEAMLRVFLHECGHIRAWDTVKDDTEGGANFWRDRWLADGRRLALENYHRADPLDILRALAEHY